MGQTKTFDKLVIDSGSGSNDYARSSDVFVSANGTNWTKAASVTGTGPLQEVEFATQTARYIKVVCTGNEGYWWSVAEFNVYNTDADSGSSGDSGGSGDSGSSGDPYVPPVSDTGTDTGTDAGNGGTTETVNNSDGSITHVYGDSGRAVTEYSADVIASKIADLSDPSIKKVVVTLPDTSASNNELVFAANAVDQLTNGKIDLKLRLKNTSLTIPLSVLEGVSADLKLEIKTLENPNNNGLSGLKAVGPVYEFTMTAVQGNSQNAVTQFKGKVTVEIGTEGINTSHIDTKKLGIYYLDEALGKWMYVGGKYNSETGMVEAKTGHFTKFAVMETNKSFSDVGSEHWAKAYIDVVAAKHITSGISETRFDPAGKVTRAQFATFLVRALGIDLPAYKGTFTDVPERQWYSAYVEAVHAIGIINGVGNDRFDPNKEITREQMAVMIVNAYTYVTGQTSEAVAKDVNTGFDDLDQASSWSKDAIKASFKLGIINGVNKTSYEPGMLAQRDQAATIIYKFLEAIEEL
jgi:hypothetical protein